MAATAEPVASAVPVVLVLWSVHRVAAAMAVTVAAPETVAPALTVLPELR
jgi:hypothetical protein